MDVVGALVRPRIGAVGRLGKAEAPNQFALGNHHTVGVKRLVSGANPRSSPRLILQHLIDADVGGEERPIRMRTVRDCLLDPIGQPAVESGAENAQPM